MSNVPQKGVFRAVWNALPCAPFWRAWLKKAFSYPLSLNVQFFWISLVLMLRGHITEASFLKLALAIIGLRQGVKLVEAYRGNRRRLSESDSA